MQLFYLPDLSAESTQVAFSKEESRHLVKVMRKKEGEHIHATNGKGLMAVLQITLADPKATSAKLIHHELRPNPKPRIHLVVAPTKMNERYEWFLEKATEIGVNKVTPIVCARSERKQVKTDRYQRVMDSAAKQSLKMHFPELMPAVGFREFLSTTPAGQCYIAHCMDTEKHSLFHAIDGKADVTILIGPEGDFTEEEVNAALEAGFIPVSLGDERLRTETAALAATHTAVLRTRTLSDPD